MEADSQRLLGLAERFADSLRDLLVQTVTYEAPVVAVVADERVVVEPRDPDGRQTVIGLAVKGEHRLDLRFRFICRLDAPGDHLAIRQSQVWLQHAQDNNPLIRFDFDQDRPWGTAHVQVHAESAALGWLHAYTGKLRPPRVQELHIPVGGKRFRPTLEDVIEFAVNDLAVDPKDGWRTVIAAGREGWTERQTAAAVRDWIRRDPVAARTMLRSLLVDETA
ncbi:hypothetical protein BH23ACT9_BH23ACT9_09340 [soil metagenome]